MKPIKTSRISDDISAQMLGLTDQHIYYFEQGITDNKVGTKSLGIHHQMLTNFQALVTSAAKDNIEIRIASGFRSFERQLMIWNNKFTGKTAIKNIKGEQVNINELNQLEIAEAILLFSALPGASRHHWGCDIDIYADNLLTEEKLQLEPWEYSESGPLARLSAWLTENMAKYNFYFPYDSYRGGIAAEPWHISYMPLAKKYHAKLSIEELRNKLIQTDIAGKEVLIDNLSTLYKRFINNINTEYPVIQ
jgi:LAS superfamily LD-carboxypeptidase LdcB